MNLETLLTVLVVAFVATVIARVFGGFTLAGLLTTYLLACLGAVGAWVAQQQLRLPVLYELPVPGGQTTVPIVWPALGALVAALLASRLWRPSRPARRSRRPSR